MRRLLRRIRLLLLRLPLRRRLRLILKRERTYVRFTPRASQRVSLSSHRTRTWVNAQRHG